MWGFRCERFPEGVAHIRTAGGTVVDFHDGQATVDDPALARALLDVPAVFEIVQVDGPDLPPADNTPPPGPDNGSRPPAGPPPKGGAGSGTPAWTAYAQAHGLDVPDGASREQIQALLVEQGIPIEPIE